MHGYRKCGAEDGDSFSPLTCSLICRLLFFGSALCCGAVRNVSIVSTIYEEFATGFTFFYCGDLLLRAENIKKNSAGNLFVDSCSCQLNIYEKKAREIGEKYILLQWVVEWLWEQPGNSQINFHYKGNSALCVCGSIRTNLI